MPIIQNLFIATVFGEEVVYIRRMIFFRWTFSGNNNNLKKKTQNFDYIRKLYMFYTVYLTLCIP